MPPANPLRLTPASGPVVRLNRRLLYVVGGVLVAVVVTGLIALRAQGSRDRGTASSRVDTRPAAERWFDKVPDREPGPRVAALDPLPPAAPSPAPPPRPAAAPPAPKGPTPEELEAQRRERAERTAMSAPIGIATFERGTADRLGVRRVGGEPGAPAGSGSIAPAPRGPVSPTAGDPSTSGLGAAADAARSKAALPPEYLRASVRTPVSPYEIKAGTIIPAVLLSAVNSDLPGQILAQVREAVYDSDTGEHLLIPQGTRLVGLYDHHIVYGQERVLITWKRLILPNGSSLSLKDGMPGTDAIGAAGFHDQVNNHYAPDLRPRAPAVGHQRRSPAQPDPQLRAGLPGADGGERPRGGGRSAAGEHRRGADPPGDDHRPHPRDPPGLPVQRDGDPGRDLPGSLRRLPPAMTHLDAYPTVLRSAAFGTRSLAQGRELEQGIRRKTERARKVNRKIKGEGRVGPKFRNPLRAGRPSPAQAATRLFGGEGRARAVAGRARRLGPVVLSTALVGGITMALSSVARLNVSPSAPVGLYRAVDQPVARGDLVVACVPLTAARLGRERGYLGQGSCPGRVQPVLKRVGAMPGDTVDLDPGGVAVNGHPLPGSATAVLDARGRPLPHAAWGRTVVPPGEVWLLTTHAPHSWDSRYFGPVRLDQVRIARALLTIGGSR